MPTIEVKNKENMSIIDSIQFAEWIAERYNYIGGEWCCWCAKQYDSKSVEHYKNTGELFYYWLSEIKKK